MGRYRSARVRNAAKARRYLKLRQAELEARGAKCEIPGCDFDIVELLQWHHRKPSEKLFQISSSYRSAKSIKAYQEELKKCDLLCPNHHAIADLALRKLESDFLRPLILVASSNVGYEPTERW